jgi:hypothetical protein
LGKSQGEKTTFLPNRKKFAAPPQKGPIILRNLHDIVELLHELSCGDTYLPFQSKANYITKCLFHDFCPNILLYIQYIIIYATSFLYIQQSGRIIFLMNTVHDDIRNILFCSSFEHVTLIHLFILEIDYIRTIYT